MKDNDYKKQREVWNRQGWSIPDFRGGKQMWFNLILGIIDHIEKTQPCDLKDKPEIAEATDVQPLKTYFPFMRSIGLVRKRSETIMLTDIGKTFAKNKSKRYLADRIQSTFRLFGEMVDLLAKEPMTVSEVDRVICHRFGLNWKNLSNTRRRTDWLEVLGLIQPIGNNKWEVTEEGLNALESWCIVSPEAIETLDEDASETIVVSDPPAEIASLLQRLTETPELHSKRNTYNIWVPSPNRIDNLRTIIQFASNRVTKADLYQFIESEFSLKESSAESMLPFLKASGLLEEVGRNIYIATPASKAWLETGNDLDFIRIIHSNMRFVGEMIRACDKDIIRNDLYAKAKVYGLNTEKARWIAGFLIEADLLEEPQYLHLKATRLGIAFIKELPLAEAETEPITEVNDSSAEVQFSNRCDSRLEKTIELMIQASVDPGAEGKASGVAFEEEIAAVFRLMGFQAKRVGGSGDTDVIVKWKDDEGKAFTAIIDAKSRNTGMVSHNDISDVAIETHRDKNNADFVAIMGHAFSGDTIKNHALKKNFALVTAEELGNIARSAQMPGLSLQEIALLFRTPNGLSQLSEIISDRQRELDVISLVVAKMYTQEDKLEELGGISPRDMYFSFEDTPISPSREELISAFETLSRLEIGILRATNKNPDPENTTYTVSDGQYRVFRMKSIAAAIEEGLPD